MADRKSLVLLQNKVQRLFIASDRERKGYIVKEDMQHMRSEVPLTADQLDAVFDALDAEKNHRLTLDHFMAGSGLLLPLAGELSSNHRPSDTEEAVPCSDDLYQDSTRQLYELKEGYQHPIGQDDLAQQYQEPIGPGDNEKQYQHSTALGDYTQEHQHSIGQLAGHVQQYQHGPEEKMREYQDLVSEPDEQKHQYQHPIGLGEQLQLIGQFGDQQLCDHVGRLCRDGIQDGGHQVRRHDWEQFLEQLVEVLKRLSEQTRQMEEVLRIRDERHQSELQQLFEEHECQLSDEKEKMEMQVERRITQMKRQLQVEVTQKDEELKEVTSLNSKAELSLRITEERAVKLKAENEKLVLQKEELLSQLELQEREMRQARQAAASQARVAERERQRHGAAGYTLARRIMLEEQGLLEQLQTLKSITKTLERHNQENCSTLLSDV